ncbi:hypothetical protein Ahy_A08g038517 [Arachis hypogaea]|uniref:Uncharacterized protein n=1 Tax=Arachis hypogaea TaxID=3818 RepID=A0A445BTM6_ARAHY|nr:hypothetical protein Ahy_A08g038517 [Arachis hypogaea]
MRLDPSCLDVGDPNYECSICGTYFWLLECVERDSTVNHLIFTVCCLKGKIQLPYLGKPPNLLYNLINGHDKEFVLPKKIFDLIIVCLPSRLLVVSQNYHRIGSLLPNAGQKPKFAKLYIYDTQHEISIDREYLVRELYQCHPSEILSLKLYSQRIVDRRTYNAPSCDEVAALIVGDFDSSDHGRDIIV